ncbi:unnamed protein product [Coregonus sp. 'balchen']|nr:unnamed protein product [Coregonus sp. 'balchen']
MEQFYHHNTHSLGILGWSRHPHTDLIIGCPQLTLHPARSLSLVWVGGMCTGAGGGGGGGALLLCFEIRPQSPSCSQLKNKQDTDVYDVSC